VSFGVLAPDDAAERLIDLDGSFEVAHGVRLVAEQCGEAPSWRSIAPELQSARPAVAGRPA
jgi:hypothetical protein